MDVVKDLCSSVAVMEKGKVVEQGEIFNVFSNPKSDVTTCFMKATSNLSKAEICCFI
jgi:D-methionine transport system ATP-binding protein